MFEALPDNLNGPMPAVEEIELYLQQLPQYNDE